MSSSISRFEDHATRVVSTLTHVATFETMSTRSKRRPKEMSQAKRRSLPKFVKSRREELGLSANEAARRAGLNISYWAKLEAGNYEAPGPTTLQAVAAVLEIPVQDLYVLVGYDTPTELPALRPYLRSRYNLPPQAVADLERYMDFLRSQYGIPADKPVFPPKKNETKQSPPRRPKSPKRRAA